MFYQSPLNYLSTNGTTNAWAQVNHTCNHFAQEKWSPYLWNYSRMYSYTLLLAVFALARSIRQSSLRAKSHLDSCKQDIHKLMTRMYKLTRGIRACLSVATHLYVHNQAITLPTISFASVELIIAYPTAPVRWHVMLSANGLQYRGSLVNLIISVCTSLPYCRRINRNVTFSV